MTNNYKITPVWKDRDGYIALDSYVLYAKVKQDFPTGWVLLWAALTFPLLGLGGLFIVVFHLIDNNQWYRIGSYPTEEAATEKICLMKAKNNVNSSPKYYN